MTGGDRCPSPFRTHRPHAHQDPLPVSHEVLGGDCREAFAHLTPGSELCFMLSGGEPHPCKHRPVQTAPRAGERSPPPGLRGSLGPSPLKVLMPIAQRSRCCPAGSHDPHLRTWEVAFPAFAPASAESRRLQRVSDFSKPVPRFPPSVPGKARRQGFRPSRAFQRDCGAQPRPAGRQNCGY